jgi:hypothetical protein
LEKAKRNIGDLMSEILRMFPGQDKAAAAVDAEGQRAGA